MLDLKAESVDRRDIVEALRHLGEPDVGDPGHQCVQFPGV